MTLEKGTLIFSNYTARVKDTGEGIESTIEEEAKKLRSTKSQGGTNRGSSRSAKVG